MVEVNKSTAAGWCSGIRTSSLHQGQGILGTMRGLSPRSCYGYQHTPRRISSKPLYNKNMGRFRFLPPFRLESILMVCVVTNYEQARLAASASKWDGEGTMYDNYYNMYNVCSLGFYA